MRLLASISRNISARCRTAVEKRRSALRIVIGYVGAAASKSIILGLIMLAARRDTVDFDVAYPLAWMISFLVLTSRK